MMANGNKKCVSCGVVYPKTAEYFYYRKKENGWLSSWCKKCKASYRKKNAQAEAERQRERRNKKPKICPVCKAKEKEYGKKYCDACRVNIVKTKKRYDKAIYKSRLRKAKPKWANGFIIKEIYDLARLRSEMTGVEWHVDHIIPIRSKKVCGLHVHSNLQVITRTDNMKKGNRFNDGNHYSFEHQGRR
jgi:hypothetical protein